MRSRPVHTCERPWLVKVAGKPSLVFLSLEAWQEEMNPLGTKLGWAVAGEDALPPSWGCPAGTVGQGEKVCVGVSKGL